MGFFDAMNKSIDVAVPLAMKLHELNRTEAFEREKFEEQKKNIALTREQLEQSIGATKRNIELQEKAQKMKEEGEAYLKGITSGGQPIQAPAYRDSWMPEGAATPTETTLSKPRTPTMEELAHAVTLRGDPIQAATILSKEATAENKDKLADVKIKIAEMVQAGKSESDINNFLKALAVANIGAGSREKVANIGAETSKKVADINKEGKVEAAGVTSSGKDETAERAGRKEEADALAKVLMNQSKPEAKGYADIYNETSQNPDVLIWKPGKFFGGKWQQVPLTGKTYKGKPLTAKILSALAKEKGITVEDALKLIESAENASRGF